MKLAEFIVCTVMKVNDSKGFMFAKNGDDREIMCHIRQGVSDLTVTPKVAGQEMRLTVRYWEGAVSVQGHAGATPVNGQGYLEMTRYAKQR